MSHSSSVRQVYSWGLLFVALFFTLDVVNCASRGVTIIGAGGVSNAINQQVRMVLAEPCPSQLFSFQSGIYSSNPDLHRNYNYEPMIVGQNFVHDIGICRVKVSTAFYYGFQVFDNGIYTCKPDFSLTSSQSLCTTTTESTTIVAPGTEEVEQDDISTRNNCLPDLSQVNSGSQQQEIFIVPKSVNIVWTSKKLFPNFPNINPLPLSISITNNGNNDEQDAGNRNIYLARCVIAPNNAADSSIVVRIPGFIKNTGALTVTFNGSPYTCDEESLEFPICISNK